jgi:hypothetical protein
MGSPGIRNPTPRSFLHRSTNPPTHRRGPRAAATRHPALISQHASYPSSHFHLPPPPHSATARTHQQGLPGHRRSGRRSQGRAGSSRVALSVHGAAVPYVARVRRQHQRARHQMWFNAVSSGLFHQGCGIRAAASGLSHQGCRIRVLRSTRPCGARGIRTRMLFPGEQSLRVHNTCESLFQSKRSS